MMIQIATGLLLAVSTLTAQAPQTAPDPGEPHVALARAAAGEEYQNLFNFLCPAPGARGGRGGGRGGGGAGAGAGGAGAAPAGAQAARGGGGGGGQRGTPDRSTWYAEPVKAFDNLY